MQLKASFMFRLKPMEVFAYFFNGLKPVSIDIPYFCGSKFKIKYMDCPCCSGKTYEECCKPYHTGEKHTPTAEALMRSRFSAFAIPNGEYLMETTLPGKRKFHNKKDLQEWGEINQWTKLEIIQTPALNHVEFKAYYTDQDGHPQIHHEFSVFQKMHDRWYYVSGEFLD